MGLILKIAAGNSSSPCGDYKAERPMATDPSLAQSQCQIEIIPLWAHSCLKGTKPSDYPSQLSVKGTLWLDLEPL